MSDRTVTVWECDHLRPCVIVGDEKFHIRHDGRTGSKCEAGSFYKLEVTPSDPDQVVHWIHRYQR